MCAEPRGSPFSASVVISMIGAGVVAFAAFLLLAAYSGDFRSGRDGRAHALSVSAVGFKGIVELLDNLGKGPTLVRSRAEAATEDLMVITLEEGREDANLRALLEMRAGRPTLLILPKWQTAPDPERPGWVAKVGPADPKRLARLLQAVGRMQVTQAKNSRKARAAGQKWLDGMSVAVPPVSQSIEGDRVVPLLALPGGGALLAQVGERPLYILADPDLLNNHGLRSGTSARHAVEILDRLNSTGAEAIAFDLTQPGLAATLNPLTLLFEPPFLALTLALTAAALLAGWYGAFRFGPERLPSRAVAFGKAALVENSAALMRMARREHRSGSAYAELVRQMAAHDSGAPPSLGGAELEAYLDRLARPDGVRFSEVAARAAAARDRTELVEAARALFQWKKEISG